MAPWAAYLILALLLLPLAFALKTVPAGLVLPVYRFGRFHRALAPGLHWVLPLIDRTGAPVELLGHRVTARGEGEAAREAEVFFQILEPGRVGSSLAEVDRMVGESLRDLLRKLPEGLDPAERASALKRDLNAALAGLGLRITRCQFR